MLMFNVGECISTASEAGDLMSDSMDFVVITVNAKPDAVILRTALQR